MNYANDDYDGTDSAQKQETDAYILDAKVVAGNQGAQDTGGWQRQ